tara:strand:+ start:74801 stop:75091 length:291 start_codon:yes stop_codon:yes gene_type:complete
MQNELSQAFDKPIYNHFTHLHGLSEGSIQLSGDLSDHMFHSPILEFNGYIAVVHEPSYIDMGNYIHFNPSPVFVPAPSGMFLLGLAGLMLARRKRR